MAEGRPIVKPAKNSFQKEFSKIDKEVDKEKFLQEMRSHIGKTGEPHLAKDTVNLTMVRHWCDAMEDFNPNYLDLDYANKSPHKNLVAPPAMMNAWTMVGLHRPATSQDPQSSALAMLDEAGYVGVVATNSEHVYERYLKLGDHLLSTQKLVDISEEKQTALGIGHFITTETEYRCHDGDYVGSMFFRILKFIPGTGKTKEPDSEKETSSDEIADTPKPKRPPPSMNANSNPFWESLKKDRLSIQICKDCQNFQHPPAVRCLKCRSINLSWQKVSGRGKLYSHARVHYPRTPAFPEPPIVALVELEEGVRLISNITDCPPEKVEIGMDLAVWFYQEDEDTFLPLFRPARPPRNEKTLKASQLTLGEDLPMCPIPITSTLIIAGAIASRDYKDVHHDPDLAKQKGSPNIFMNILTSSGLAARYISDWAGPDVIYKNLKLRLGAPNHPHDCMMMSGKVEEINGSTVQVSFQGINSLGPHLTGTAELELLK